MCPLPSRYNPSVDLRLRPFAMLVPISAVLLCLAGCVGTKNPTAATPSSTSAPSSAAPPAASPSVQRTYTLHEYSVPAGSHPHDVAPAPDGKVWYTAQATGELGLLDPAT